MRARSARFAIVAVFLNKGFRDRWYFWEVVVLARKASLLMLAFALRLLEPEVRC